MNRNDKKQLGEEKKKRKREKEKKKERKKEKGQKRKKSFVFFFKVDEDKFRTCTFQKTSGSQMKLIVTLASSVHTL